MVGEQILAQLIILLKPKRLIAIGTDAAKAVNRLGGNLKIHEIRHPSYGGQTQFIRQTRELYGLPERETKTLF